MNPEAMSAIAAGVPGAVNRADPDPDWPDDVHIVPEDDPLAAELEDDLFAATDPDGSLDKVDATITRPPEPTSPGPLFDEHDDADVPGIAEDIAARLRERFGEGWPGAPGGAGAGGGRTRRPNPDAYGFYLPWHQFSPAIWGIYLTIEGVEELGREIQALAPILSQAEARRAAKLFIFHHEAYHNAVETFAARLEATHRQPCYLIGVIRCHREGLPKSGLHEEALASAYAFERVRKYVLDDVDPPPPRLAAKRKAAAGALRDIIARYPPPYDGARLIIDGTRRFTDVEQELQETCLARSITGVPGAPPEIWLAASRFMTPSLSRNKRFSYAVSRDHPTLRHAARVPQFPRREVLRRMPDR